MIQLHNNEVEACQQRRYRYKYFQIGFVWNSETLKPALNNRNTHICVILRTTCIFYKKFTQFTYEWSVTIKNINFNFKKGHGTPGLSISFS
jgi:hypothetical protein